MTAASPNRLLPTTIYRFPYQKCFNQWRDCTSNLAVGRLKQRREVGWSRHIRPPSTVCSDAWKDTELVFSVRGRRPIVMRSSCWSKFDDWRDGEGECDARVCLISQLCIYIIDLTIMSSLPKQKQDDAEPILQTPPPQQPAPEPLAITYGESSISMKCPFCLQHIRSEIILKPEFISIVLGISIFVIVPHMAMMLLVIMLMHFTASRKHRCPLCERQLGHDGKFLLYFTDQVYSLTLFSAGFIFTKKMVVTGVLLLFAITVLSLRVAQMENERWVPNTWPQYVEECSSSNPDNCLQKYHGKEFRNWEGHLLRLIDNRQNSRKYYQHAVSLFMKMEPRVRQDSQPDVLLTLDSGAVYDNSAVLATLQHGDLLRFNCSLHERYRGTLHDVMHFHVEQLEVVGHDQQYAMYTSEIEEEWIRIHVENKGGLTSEPDQPKP